MTRQHAPVILLFLIGALATLLSLTAIRTAGAEPLLAAAAAEPPLEVRLAPLPVPSDAIDGVEDVRDAARSHGWALGALVGLILVGRTLRRARHRWPDSRALAWMGGPIGLVVGGAVIVASAAYDALALGGSWLAAGFAAVGAVLYLLDPDPVPRQPRRAEAGSARLATMLLVVIVGLALACGGAHQRARDTAGHVVDCTTSALTAGAEQYAGQVRDAFVVCGADWICLGDRLVELARSAGIEVVGCAAQRTVLEMHGVAPVDLQGWTQVRIERLGGRVFDLGTVRP